MELIDEAKSREYDRQLLDKAGLLPRLNLLREKIRKLRHNSVYKIT